MRLVLVSDAWFPQVNGVVRTLDTVRRHLTDRGWQVLMVTPDRFRTVPCPTYPEIRLSVFASRKVAEIIDAARPSAIHIATEGPLGLAARRYCVRGNLPFTTAYHTRFPEYIQARIRLPVALTYRLLRWFHGRSSTVMVATNSVEADLRAAGFTRLRHWSRGVDTELFHPRDKGFLSAPRPISMYVGRVAVEKNLEAFLSLDLPGTKYVVGDGPQRRELQAKYPDARFSGVREGEDLAAHLAAADVFVFPSRTDTFGMVMLEALASGVPIAAYPVAGPLDVIDQSGAGILDGDLKCAVERALQIPAQVCRDHALKFSWDRAVDQFVSNLDIFDPAVARGGEIRTSTIETY
jgi:glycosyltransferase involved in cell wall biosynthesis